MSLLLARHVGGLFLYRPDVRYRGQSGRSRHNPKESANSQEQTFWLSGGDGIEVIPMADRLGYHRHGFDGCRGHVQQLYPPSSVQYCCDIGLYRPIQLLIADRP